MVGKKANLSFVEIEKKEKTSVFSVKSTRDGSYLGKVYWYAPWRQYVFEPDNGAEYDQYEKTVFNWGCLAELSSFIKKLMEERKARRGG